VRATSTVSLSPRSSADLPQVPDRPESVAAEIRRLGIRPSRSLGQSFLTDSFIADAEAALLETPPGVPVLEVGPGLGILTRALLARGRQPLWLIERDRRLAAYLRERFGSGVSLLEGDALSVKWPPVGAMVGNLPFSVATAVLTKALALRIPLWVALVQREVGERLAASPGSRSYGRLTVLAALYGTIERFLPVPASAFCPKPEVEGLVVRFRARSDPLPVPSVPAFENLLRALFSHRRKMLGNILPRVIGVRSRSAPQEAGWPEDWMRRRPEELRPDLYFRLAAVLSSQ
jgi:16S rRNA (adenine1518-N6/adenine1519-N6)-dimethyltransferase